MKKDYFILLLLLLFCFSLPILAQTKQEAISALKSELITTNNKLPIKASFFSLQKMDIVENDFVVYMKFDENQEDLDRFIDNMNESKSNMFALVSGQRQEFAKLFITSGLNLKYIVSGNISKRIKTISLSSSVVKNAWGKDYSSIDYIKDLVVKMNENTPEDWGDGLTCTSIRIEGQYICYLIKTDETFLTIPLLKATKAEGLEMENGIIKEFNSTNDAADLFFIKYLKQSNMGIRYTYWSERTADVVVLRFPLTR